MKYITTLRGNSHQRRKAFRAIKRKYPTAVRNDSLVYAKEP